jgi:hypothetical protein
MDGIRCQNCNFLSLPRAIECARCRARFEILPDGIILKADGVNGRLEMSENSIIIRRHGLRTFFTHGLQGDKEILISRISSIQFKKPGIARGYIQFTFSGGQEAKRGLFQAAADENSVLFDSAHLAEFERFKDELQKRMR